MANKWFNGMNLLITFIIACCPHDRNRQLGLELMLERTFRVSFVQNSCNNAVLQRWAAFNYNNNKKNEFKYIYVNILFDTLFFLCLLYAVGRYVLYFYLIFFSYLYLQKTIGVFCNYIFE